MRRWSALRTGRPLALATRSALALALAASAALAAMAVAFWAIIGSADSTWAQSPLGSSQSAARRSECRSAQASTARDVRSCHFLLHTDLPADEANQLVARLEAMLQQVSSYWGRPMQGVIECYVVRDLDVFPKAAMAPAGMQAIPSPGGVTLMRTVTDGRRYLAKSVVYANDQPGVALHEAVHAYCHHTFGRVGPVWYSEGMAELCRCGIGNDAAVHADARDLAHLRAQPPASIDRIVSPTQTSGDGWQSYAPRWALCHFLYHHPAYSGMFAALGRGYLTGQDVSFEQAYAGAARELAFEYAFFLDHLAAGYRVDLCAWDWSRKSSGLPAGRTHGTTVAAGRGWQPTGLCVVPGTRIAYATKGRWRAAGDEVDADGDRQGRGRLVGVLMNDYRLGPEFELGVQGSIRFDRGGDLYLRCRNDWNALADDAGRMMVKLKSHGRALAARAGP